MKLLDGVSIRARINVMIAIVTASFLLTAALNAVNYKTNRTYTAKAFEQANSTALDSGELRESMAEMRRLEASIMAIGSSNSIEVERLGKEWEHAVAASQAVAERIGKGMSATDEMRTMAANHAKFVGEYAGVIKPLIAQMRGAQIDGAVALAYAAKADGTIKQMVGNVEALAKAQLARIEVVGAQANERATIASVITLALMGISLALFLPIAWLTSRAICRPLDRVARVAERIADGNLDNSVDEAGHDEIGRVVNAIAAMQQRLRGLVGEIRSTADSIQVASNEVAAGNQDLSQRTEQAAGSLQQTASSIEELTGSVRNSADAAAQANQLATSAAEVAARGGQVVAQVVNTMDEINGSSKKIADIIGVIDGIAFQTNILALNAAVEAARAGEQGRGFAVVAGEVRSLAQRSAEAAKEIKALIGASVDKVEAGSRLVKDAGATMGEIVASVQRVSDIIGEISSASVEQSRGIGQVNSAVAQLDQMTQRNASLVEESAAAAQSLREQANKLGTVVATFQLAPGMPAPPARSVAPSIPDVTPGPRSEARHVEKPAPVVKRVPAEPRPAAHETAATKLMTQLRRPEESTPGDTVRPAAGPQSTSVKPASRASDDGDWESF